MGTIAGGLTGRGDLGTLEQRLGRLNDAALLQLLDAAIAFARARGLETQLADIMGENLAEMRLEAEARKAAAGAASLFHALPSVIAAQDTAP